jgi:hypothetical protein
MIIKLKIIEEIINVALMTVSNLSKYGEYFLIFLVDIKKEYIV